MATSKTSAPSEKLSFAKIAAAGLKASSVSSTPINKALNAQKQNITSAPRDGNKTVIPSNSVSAQARQVRPTKVAHPPQESVKGPNGPEVHVHTVQDTSPQPQSEHPSSGLLAPIPTEEVKDTATLDSFSSGSAKPPSLDGKSVASGTTFALDEKESLRPDDSASVKAVEDEEVFSPAESCPPDADSESDVRAFRDQLREISSMEPSRHELAGQGYGNSSDPSPGVLYIPPEGLGMGTVPGPGNNGGDVDFGPHPKLLEALTVPQNRIWVLKLEQDVTDFVKDPKEPSLHLPQCNSYQRMLAHKIADYYRLGHVVNESNSSVRLFKTPYCRLPPPLTGIATPSTADSTPPPSAPQMKILRRGDDSTPAIANGSGLPSKSGSDDDTDDSQRPKKPMSYEERVANYESVRLRIMGSAKPNEAVEEPKVNETSRSSSAAGKKSKKKHRSDSDEGFDTRSAYNTFYPTQQGSNSFSSTPLAYTGYGDPIYGDNANIGSFSQQTGPAFHPYTQGQGGMAWTGTGFAPNNGAQQWNSGQASGYDLSNEFQRVMSFQTPAGAAQPATGYDGTYNQQFYNSQQTWQQQQPYQAAHTPSTAQSTYAQQQRRPTSSGQYQDPQQPYAFGQLPSQTFPGRPPSKLEHPIPGSYKGKYFNPHSQSFIPGQQGVNNTFRPYTPQNQMSPAGFNSGYSMQRQHSAQSQTSSFGSPHHPAGGVPLQMQHQQPMNHPLPQPVFPQQPSPNVPLPPKPGSTPQKQGPHQGTASPVGSVHENSPSSIAKWGAPASLPAKPPPSAEPFDPSRFPHVQRQPSYNTAASARVPSGAMPSFGSMPPMGGNGLRS